ncbi:MAG TPA: tyrosine-type recombinase/integrase [Methanotrichaceae archaeon]|nr:tyrosine-type recombinase/integrase [Methanotrichaceae archaeon]HQI92242.1 tyrosine-type recombinase/integrase [Methanotrichaceae archaeon]
MIKDDLIDSFQQDCKLRNFATARVYARTAKNYCRWMEENQMDVFSVTNRELKEYLHYLHEDRHLKFESIRRIFSHVGSFYDYLVDEGMVTSNPIPTFVKRYLSLYKKNDSERRQLVSIQEAAKLVSATLETRDRAIILLFLKTGMRLGEMAKLDVSDIDPERMTLTLKPTAKRSNRMLFFDHETALALQRWLNVRELRKGHDGPALFLSNQGKRICRNHISALVAKHAEVVGLHNPTSPRLDEKFGPHCCHHWFTTHLLRAGMRREYVKWLRGDSIREAIDIYYHIDPEDVRRSYMACIPQLGV